jgi:AbrB family looped-hinge helix DNA binding protein
MYYMKFESKMTSKGTITIAAPLRKALGLKPGQTVELELDEKDKRVFIDTGITPDEFEMARQRLVSKIPKRKLGMPNEALRQAIEKAKKAEAKRKDRK